MFWLVRPTWQNSDYSSYRIYPRDDWKKGVVKDFWQNGRVKSEKMVSRDWGCNIFYRKDKVQTLSLNSGQFYDGHFFLARHNVSDLLTFVNVFIYERRDFIQKFESLERILLLLGKMGRGKTGTNMFNWRDASVWWLTRVRVWFLWCMRILWICILLLVLYLSLCYIRGLFDKYSC